jgi:hypothetical protein
MVHCGLYINREADRPGIFRLIYGPNSVGHICTFEQYKNIQCSFDYIMDHIGAMNLSSSSACNFYCTEYSIGYSTININQALKCAIQNPRNFDDVVSPALNDYIESTPRILDITEHHVESPQLPVGVTVVKLSIAIVIIYMMVSRMKPIKR